MCQGTAAPASVNGLTFVGWNEPIACGGCAIFPGDVIVADDDGAVVIPQDLVEFVAAEGEEHERYETWVVSEVERGVPLPGLYPPNDEAKARYEAWKPSAADRPTRGRSDRCSSCCPRLLGFFAVPSNVILAAGASSGVLLMAHALRALRARGSRSPAWCCWRSPGCRRSATR